MINNRFGVQWGLAGIALLVVVTMASPVVGAPCTWCDFTDGSCCSCQSAIGGDPLPCPCSCGGGNRIEGGVCMGDQGPCRKPRGNCVWGWDKLCCEAIGGHVDLSCPQAVPEPADGECDEEQAAGPERSTGLVAILLMLLALPIIALRFGSGR